MASAPDWNSQGLLPPCNRLSPTSADRSPYRVDLLDLVLDFAVTAERVAILKGLLEYRAELHALGLVEGMQWLDGSFFEHIELLENRPPGDMDVVTFHVMPAGQTQMTLKVANPGLFPFNEAERLALKALYHVDAFTQSLSSKPEYLVGRSAYWYSLWAHRRDMTWKGYIEIDLAPANDAATLQALTGLPQQPPTLVLPPANGQQVPIAVQP